MKDLCDFLGVSFDPHVCGLAGSDQRFIGDRSTVPLGHEVQRLDHRDPVQLPAADLARIRRFEQQWARRFPAGYAAMVGRPGQDESGDLFRVRSDLVRAFLYAIGEAAKKWIFAAIPLNLWAAYRARRDDRAAASR